MAFEVNSNLSEVAAEIQPSKLKARGFFPPKRVAIIEGEDSDQEEAYYVYLVYPNRTPGSALMWDKIEPMVSWVRQYVWEHTGYNRYPYVKVKREQQLSPGL